MKKLSDFLFWYQNISTTAMAKFSMISLVALGVAGNIIEKLEINQSIKDKVFVCIPLILLAILLPWIYMKKGEKEKNDDDHDY